MLLVTLYWPTWQSMLKVWNTPTYSHSYLIPFASVWLAYSEREKLRQYSVRPWWAMIPAIVVLGFAWLVGSMAGVNTLMHFAVVCSAALLIAFAFGRDIARHLLFPLSFLLLAVPFGDFLVPYMMTWTANITIFLVQASGVPIYREGLFFVLPSGAWEVVEECSGQRYLIALLPLALMFSHLNYLQVRTKVLFVVASIAVAVVANWVRAYLIVMTGHLSDMKIAAGVDHLIYGWFFFGIVVLGLFWWGMRWKEQPETKAKKSTNAAEPIRTQRLASPYPVIASIAAGTFAIATGAVVAPVLASGEHSTADVMQRLNTLAVSAPTKQSTALAIPFEGADGQVKFSMAEGKVDVWAATYKNASADTEMIRGSHSVTVANRKNWRHVGTESVSVPGLNGATGTEFRFSTRVGELIAWQLFFVNEKVLGNEQDAKIQLALQRLRGGGAVTSVVILWSQVDTDPKESRDRLSDSAERIVRQLGAHQDAE